MKKKILFIIDTLRGGGAEKVLIDILENINYTKYEIDLFLIRKTGVYLKSIPQNIRIKSFLESDNKGKFKYFLRNKLYILTRKYPKLINFIIKDNYDVGIAFLEGESTYFLSNLKKCKKNIAWVHIDIEKHRMYTKEKEEKFYKFMDKIICVSKDSKASFLRMYPKYRNKVDIIYNPINKEKILLKSKEKIKERLDKEKINLITIGRLNYQKGYDLLLQAILKIIKTDKIKNIKLYILGEGPEKEKLEKYILKNNLEDNIELLGFKENPYPYIKEADICVSASRYEGYQLVLMEALCLKKPIVATKCTGPRELLDNGKYGILAEVESVESIYENLKRVILDKDLQKELSTKAGEKSKDLGIEGCITSVENLFDNGEI